MVSPGPSTDARAARVHTTTAALASTTHDSNRIATLTSPLPAGSADASFARNEGLVMPARRPRPGYPGRVNEPSAVPEVLSADLPPGAFLLDVREDDEWTAGHAPDAVHVRLGDLGARAAELPRDREVYVICRSGARSAYAAQVLAGAGWTAVNVADGMTGWAVAGRPMVSEDGSEPHVA